jgi:glycosyltransferase involved in cell wall biosynthesis/4-amino-4-deoxy-L-arabinose transferase-like glycosyltransferase
MAKVSIVIPAFNEAPTLPELIRRVQAVSLQGIEKEIIVVDNNSTDDTHALARAAGVKVLREPVPGKGAAVRTGFRAATGDILLIQDADLEYDPADYPALLKPIIDGTADAVLGIRTPSGKGAPHRGILYNLGNFAITLTSNLLYGASIPEYTGGYKVFRAAVVKDVVVRTNDFAYEHELVAKLMKRGCRFTHRPIAYHPRTSAEGKKIGWKDGFKILWTVIRSRFPEGAPLRVYAILFAVSIITAGGSIAYLSDIASHSGTELAREYPAPSTSVAHDYGVLTVNVVERGVFSLATTSPYTPDAWRTPGYIWFTVPIYALFHSFFPVLIAQIFTLFLTVLLVYRMAKRVLGERWAFGISLIYLFLPDTMLSASALLNENLFMLVFMVALYFFFFTEQKGLYVKWGVTGILLALTAYIKPASLYILIFFIPGLFLFYLPWKEISRKHIIAALIMILSFVATLFPWCVRNHLVLNTWQYATTGAFELFRQNATQFYEAYHHIPNLEARYALEDMAGLPHGSVPLDPTYSPVLEKVALKVIFEHPVSYAFYHLTTFIPFFTSSGANDYRNFADGLRPDFNPTPEPSLLQAIHPFSLPVLLTVLKNHGWTLLENSIWAFVTVLILIGLWKSKERRLMHIFFVLMLYFAVVTGPIAHARYRIPVEPLMLIAAASTIAYFYERRAASALRG